MQKRRVPYFLILVGLVMVFCLAACGIETQEGMATPTLTPTTVALPVLETPTPTAVSSQPQPTSAPTVTASPIPSPTPIPTSTPTPSACEGLSGAIEVRLMVGPGAAVGLETHAVGSVPFTVTSGGPPFGVAGSDHISYHEVLSEDEINYDVSFEADVIISGTCVDAPGETPHMELNVDMGWNQVVEVTARDFHRVYPTSGNNSAPINLLLIDGDSAFVGGGSMELVLRLGSN